MAEPTPLSELLTALPRSSELILEAAIRAVWIKVVGEPAALNSLSRRLKDQILYVSTRDAVWATQLSLMKRSILEKMEKIMPGVSLEDMRFSHAGWAQNKKTVDLTDTFLSSEDLAAIDDRLRTAPAEFKESLFGAATATALIKKERSARGWKECPSCGRLSPEPVCSLCRRAALKLNNNDIVIK